MDTHVEANTNDQYAGKVWCTTRNCAQPRPAIGGLFRANGRSHTDGYQRKGQTNAEAQYQHTPQGDFFDLKAEQQNGDSCRARNQPPVNPNMMI